MSDLIDRQAAIDYIKSQRGRLFKGFTIEEAVLTLIREVPSMPERWIPCSERLPEKSWTAYLITFPDYNFYEDGRVLYVVDIFGYEDGKWVYDYEEDVEIIAWMPLPEPYKGAQS